jgi:hypothetical protein
MALTFVAKPDSGSDDEQELVPNPSYWGPLVWEVLYISVAGYSVNPGVPEKIGFQLFLDSMRYVLPCAQCRAEYDKYLSTNPLTNMVMASKTSLFEWLYNLHRSVSMRLMKAPMSSLLEMQHHYFPPKVSQLAALQLQQNAGPITARGLPALAAPVPSQTPSSSGKVSSGRQSSLPLPSASLPATGPPRSAFAGPPQQRNVAALVQRAIVPIVSRANVRSAVRTVYTRREAPIVALSQFQKPRGPTVPHFPASASSYIRPQSALAIVRPVSVTRATLTAVRPQSALSTVRPSAITLSRTMPILRLQTASQVRQNSSQVRSASAQPIIRGVNPLQKSAPRFASGGGCGCRRNR